MLALAALLAASCASNPALDAAAEVPVTTRIVVHKQAHVMRAYRAGALLREFRVALGRGGLGPKVRQGDGRVPEGAYVIDGRNPDSAFHLSLHISYPTREQVRAAAALGADAGRDIMIHGLPNGRGSIGDRHRLADWTEGCIAVTNAEIEWLWRSVPDGTPITILP
ncbi:MAG: L,D-transpeptidase family protein [Sphingomonas sp.]|nr:L,D-transpeptidase family protein [Sphingomonas sp.]